MDELSDDNVDESWQIAIPSDADDYKVMCDKNEHGMYRIRISRRFTGWKVAFGDLMDYANSIGKNTVLIMAESELNEIRRSYHGHSFKDAYLRDNEPDVLVHSTPLQNWEYIQRDGCLMSWNQLKKNKRVFEEKPLGSLLGDPAEFSDYIMLGTGIMCEIVVASKQAGKIVMDANKPYMSGARLYLDARKLASDGCLIRDGVHVKVKDSLTLTPYLLWAATWENIGINGRESTPREFAEIADQVFEERKLYANRISSGCI